MPDARHELALRLELERRKSDCPIAYFRPHDKQKAVFDGLQQKRVALFIGANRTGKTLGASAWAIAASYGYRIWDVPGIKVLDSTGDLPARDQVPREHWIMRPNGRPLSVPNTGFIVSGLPRERGLGQIIWPEIERLIPPRVRAHPVFRVPKGAQGVPSMVEYPNHSRVILASSDQDDLTFEGTRVQWAWADEPVRPFVFTGLMRGLMVDQGTFLFTLTPLGNDATWLHHKFIANGGEEAVVVPVTMYDNPYLSTQAIEEFEKQGEWSDAERRARLYGEFESLGTRVLYNFRREHHVVQTQELPDSLIHGMVVDPHHVRPAACIWFAFDPLSKVYTVYREWPTAAWPSQTSGGKTPSEYAMLFRTLEGRRSAELRIADPKFATSEFAVNGVKQSAWAEEMRKCGLEFQTEIPDVKTIEVGEQRLVEMLKWADLLPRGPNNCPKLAIMEHCKNVIAACENYSLLPVRDRSINREKRSEVWKDWIDCLRYMVLTPLPHDLVFGGPVYDPFTDEDWAKRNGTQL